MDLDETDAHFVDVIHTGAGILGQWGPNGHADFYVNGGSSQPGCATSSLLQHEASSICQQTHTDRTPEDFPQKSSDRQVGSNRPTASIKLAQAAYQYNYRIANLRTYLLINSLISLIA
ncbi:phospholipase A1 member A-like isoform X2 [Vespula squamosa]|uniref:phospholipase A1 n=1 Tax=Vespula squamosa TaxID=30214 RepID=A0ABD2A1D4_VESSQ